MNLFRLVSVWALLAGCGLYLAQIPEFPGIFLMMFMASFFTGMLFHVALIALLVEALTRRVPRIFAIIPILAYSGYYAAYFSEPYQLAAKELTLRAANPTPILFDASRYSLVHDKSMDVVDRYSAPSVYESLAWASGTWVVHFLVSEAQCKTLKESGARIDIRDLAAFSAPGACHITFPFQPPLPLFEIMHSRENRGIYKDEYETTDIMIDRRLKARYVALHTTRLLAFPLLFAGCSLNDSSSTWDCHFNFARKPLTLNPYPGSNGSTLDDVKLVGLHQYGRDPFRDFRGYPENDGLIKYINSNLTNGARGLSR